ncbi:MAG: GMC family oxidoreductase [Gammaproteobacteria bacterium]|nr:GMC family oxidoreductase [Gammaproteobacteria bacterium]MCP4831305.1 GMC family oxidoreductase [Gammaproteobacteria bacterium]
MTVINPDKVCRAEVVVIGSGPGGSVVAATLAQGGKDVLLIEEGQNRSQNSCAPFSYAEMKQKYRNNGITAAFGKPNIAYAEGSCVGGGSEVNSGLYHRAPDAVIEAWAKDFMVDDFSPVTMANSFAACEAVMQPSIYPGVLPVQSQILRRGAETENMSSSDVPRLVDFSGEKDEQGVAISSRRAMSKTYLPEFFKAGGQLLPETRVHRLKRHGRRWQIFAHHGTGRKLQIDADNVFVCAGAIHSPALLQRSGIRMNVGQTLSMQPMIKLTAAFDEPVNFQNMGIAGEQVKEQGSEYSFGCSISSRAHLAINLAADVDGPEYALQNHRNLVSYYVMSCGTMDGSVRVLPGFNDPLVRYQISTRELNNLGQGMQGLARVLLSAGATQVFTGLADSPVVTNQQQVDTLPGTLSNSVNNIMTVHLMASCPMGEDRKSTAVNSWGQVHGQPGLHISDVSILCASPGVNPQGTVMALAKRNSDYFLNN